MLSFVDRAVLLHLAMNEGIQLAAGFIIGRNNQRAFRLAPIFLRDCLEAFFPVLDLMDSALAFKIEGWRIGLLL